MSRKIKTKMTDKQASLAMWSWIMWCIIHDYRMNSTVRYKKIQWTNRHEQKFNWIQNCWLCSCHELCKGCPLKTCTEYNTDNAYQKVRDYINLRSLHRAQGRTQELKSRALEGCREILQAIEQEVEK